MDKFKKCQWGHESDMENEMPQQDSIGPNLPRRTGKPSQYINIEGCLIPWLGSNPLLIKVGGCNDWFLPIFSTKEKLDAALTYFQKSGIVKNYSIKQIDKYGQTEFLDSVFESGIRVMLDPQIINDHHTKWTEVVKE